MSTFNNPPFVEGEALTASGINSKAGSLLETAVNALDEASMERHALDSQHLPALSMSDIFTAGFEVGASNTLTNYIAGGEYQNTLPLYAATQYPFTYQTFDSTIGGSALAVYGPSDWATNGVAHIEAGWRIPDDPGNSTNFRAELPLAAATNFDTANIRGVLCRASAQPIWAGNTVKGGGVSRLDTALALCIGFEDGLGARYVVERSVRFYTVEATRPNNADTMTFLTQDDLDAGNGECAKIFLAVATATPGDTGWTPNSGLRSAKNNDLHIRYYNLSTTPIQAGDF